MARIPLQEIEDAPPEVRAVYDRMLEVRGYVNNVAKLFGTHPTFLEGFSRLVLGLYGTGAKLAPRLRELAYLRASQLNSCHY